MTVGRVVLSAVNASSADPNSVTVAPWCSSTRWSSSRASGSSSITNACTPSSLGSGVASVESTSTAGCSRSSSACTSEIGRSTTKVAPRPSPGLLAWIAPAWSSTSCLQMARPSPRPPWLRVVEPSRCEKRSNTCGRKLAGMPAPVSETLSSTCEFTRCTSTCTWPPRGVNLIALVSRFQATCCRRALSALTRVREESSRLRRRTSLASAIGRAESIAACTTSDNETCCRSRRILPARMRLRSSRSSISCTWARALRSITWMARCWSTVLFAWPLSRIWVQPRMALSGVRSSCDRVARNSSLMRVARWAAMRALRSASSSCSRSWLFSSIASSRRLSVRSRVSLAKPCSRPVPSRRAVIVTLAQNRLPSLRRRQPVSTKLPFSVACCSS